jgi:Oxidoreductase FAD-binding domain
MERTALRGRLKWQAAAVTSVTRETASVVTIELDPPDWPGHQAGQHLEVCLTAEDGYQAERQYPIASAPGESVAITVERLENGEVSPYLTEELRAGDELEMRGPIAEYFVWEPSDGGPLMLGVTDVDLSGLASLDQPGPPYPTGQSLSSRSISRTTNQKGTEEMSMSSEGLQGSMSMQAPQGQMMMQGGHVYVQTNEIRNCVIHYFRAPDGKLTEVERVFTGGAGSGPYKPVSDQDSAPNAFEGANSVILTPDRRFLFATNGGDNSVSSFAVGVDGKLTLLDAKRTGNVVDGRSGTAKALAYSPSHSTLYVLHAFGPDHLRLMSVDGDGNLTARPEGYTINTPDKPRRVATMAALTADEKFIVVGTTFDEPAKSNPDGSPILWVQKNGTPHSIASNAPDPDGLIVFPIGAYGALGEGKFQDGGGGSPWNVQFLHQRTAQAGQAAREDRGDQRVHVNRAGKADVS